MYQEKTVPSDIRTEHSLHIFKTHLRVIIIQDIKAVTFNLLLVYKPIVFYLMKSASFSSQFNSLFILYISKAKPLSLLRGILT